MPANIVRYYPNERAALIRQRLCARVSIAVLHYKDDFVSFSTRVIGSASNCDNVCRVNYVRNNDRSAGRKSRRDTQPLISDQWLDHFSIILLPRKRLR